MAMRISALICYFDLLAFRITEQLFDEEDPH
jgi:hypothetical protein